MKNQYVKWLVKLALFVMVFVLSDFLFGLLIKSCENRFVKLNPDAIENKTNYLLNEVNAEVIIIGASEVEYSYRPDIISDSLNMSVYNCGKNAQGLYYQTTILNSILDRYIPKLIVWSIAPNCLTPHENEMDRVTIFKPYYHENSYCRALLQKRSWYEKFKMLSYYYTYNSEFHSYFIHLIKPESNNTKYGYRIIEKGGAAPVLEERKWEDAPEELRVSMFTDVVNRLKEKNIRTVFVFSPHYSSGDYHNLDSYILLKKIIDDRGFILIEDYYHYPPLMYNSYFKDKDHLSEEGVLIFSQHIAHELKVLYK